MCMHCVLTFRAMIIGLKDTDCAYFLHQEIYAIFCNFNITRIHFILQRRRKNLQANNISTTKIIENSVSVLELNQLAAEILDANFNRIAVKGEISNVATPYSGHIYFSLKDKHAQIRCALFRQNRRNLALLPEDGAEVVLTARVSIYAPRGDYQLIVDNVFPIGAGELQALFQKRLKKLKQAGLFAKEHKLTIPQHPQQVGIVTSATGAALQDILKVLKRRCPSIKVRIFPATVQGEQAAAAISAALKQASNSDCDVIILGRGGGSAEDLWAFNDEELARQIFACKTPIVTGIGHEVDTTIADFVADLRAATPSAAAECVSPNYKVYYQQLQDYILRATNAIDSKIARNQEMLSSLAWQLKQVNPKSRLEKIAIQLKHLSSRLTPHLQVILEYKKSKFNFLCRSLDNLSPLQTLCRGYSIAKKDGKILQHKTEFKKNMTFELELQDGKVACTSK